jgi:hypothetical protein
MFRRGRCPHRPAFDGAKKTLDRYTVGAKKFSPLQIEMLKYWIGTRFLLLALYGRCVQRPFVEMKR